MLSVVHQQPDELMTLNTEQNVTQHLLTSHWYTHH